jgi:hypothetical protein
MAQVRMAWREHPRPSSVSLLQQLPRAFLKAAREAAGGQPQACESRNQKASGEKGS